jgi:hypothetical protein
VGVGALLERQTGDIVIQAEMVVFGSVIAVWVDSSKVGKAAE